ncbi:protein kinase domain-containing protein [Nonomuraea sp. SYSU D8015]|uniref:protein kinase domain-containing protein n=1 Tax=Nonomuraea sp. SYSU D8015 TaxID=2593644 RepID=UPI001CB6E23F|nr:protein kinase [Nonomuraea sp. SYSU D8015]
MIGPETALAGRYHLLSRLGSGGHGEVWRARDTLLDRVVAVKTVRAGLDGDPEFAARFHAEARSMATVDHPGVVAVFDYGIAEMPGRRTPYLVMQYLDGEPLHLLLSRRGRIAAGPTMDLVAQAAAALQAAHEAGIVHRDVKPGNLMIRPDGTVVLTDFGIARTADDLGLTASGIVLGTATYCAPEQAEGDAPTPAMDVYALGVVAYECLAGRAPFDGESAVAIALKHLHEMPPPLPADVPVAVAEVVKRALAKDPDDRWPTAAAFAAAARALAGDAGRPLADGQPAGRGAAADGRGTGASGGSAAVAPRGAASAADARTTSAGTGERGAARDGGTTGRARAIPATVPGRDRADGPDRGRAAGAGQDRVGGPGRDGAGAGRAPAAGMRRSRRAGIGALAVGGGLAAALIAGAAVSWSLMRDTPPSTAALQARIEEQPPSAQAEPSLEPMTDTEDGEVRDKPPTSESSADPGRSTESGTTEDPKTPTESRDPAPAPGVLAGGIVHVGGASPSPSGAADGYRPGLVEVYTAKGRRVAEQRSDRRGFRFSLPPGGYRLQTDLGDETCSTKAEVESGRTTRVDLKCTIAQPPPSPVFLTAGLKDVAGDVKEGPNAGEAPPYADLLSAATKAGEDGVTLEFVTAGPVPTAVPSEGDTRRHWAASFEQGGRTATLSITGVKGTWTVQWAAKDGKTGLPDKADQATAPAKPVISGPRVSVALGPKAPLKAAPIDFTKPYRIVAAESHVVQVSHGWSDTAP